LNQLPPADPAIVVANTIQAVGQVVLLVAMIGSVAGLAVRFRCSTGVERQQLKWFTYAATLDVLLLVVWTVIVLDPLAGALSFLTASCHARSATRSSPASSAQRSLGSC
jgi:hypothetical protein